MGEFLKKLIPYGCKTKVQRGIFNQKGAGLVTVMIAAAIVAITAMVVSDFIVDQARQTKRLEISGSCQNIANSLVEFFKKDESSLFISSFGAAPGTVNFPAGLAITDDNIDRFTFGLNGAGGFISPVFTGGATMSIATDGATTLPGAFNYYNHLNIKNSTNRLVALSIAENFCCGDNLENPNCGARYFDNDPTAGPASLWVTRPGFTINEKDVEVDLKVNFPGIACSGGTSGTLPFASRPASDDLTTANFKVEVVMRRGTTEEKRCSATGSVQKTPDANAPLTLLEYDEATLCNAGQNNPAQCGASAPVRITVRSFKNTAGNNCSQNCIQNAAVLPACEIGGNSLFNTITSANISGGNSCDTDCTMSDPGTVFLCKIGEKSWFNSLNTGAPYNVPSSANFWEPCETAMVRDWDGVTSAGNVSITYNPLVGSATRTEQAANAVITLTNLTSNRAYVVNVRAVDTAGNVGPAFCGYTAAGPGSDSCLSTSPAHFTVINGTPTVGALDDTTNRVELAGQPVGTDNTLINTNPPRYSTVLSQFNGMYQCAAGGPQFASAVTYTPAVPAPAIPPGTSCTAVLSYPNATTATLNSTPNAAGVCTCAGAACTAQLSNIATNGDYSITMTAQNDCGNLPAIPAVPWCLDSATMAGAATYVNSTNLNPNANFVTTVTEPTTAVKACGVTSLCPMIDGSFTKNLVSCNTPNSGATVWDPMIHSGCIADPNTNYSVTLVDPCGRYQETTTNVALTRGISYTSTLESVPHISVPAAHQCFRYAGTQRGGNICEPGSYCSINGKCFNTCPTAGNACTAATDCDHPSYGVTSAQASGPQCVGNRCTCPTNPWTPAANNCAPLYCPVLNSSTYTITPSVPAGGACQSCSHWTVGPWGACVAGNLTRVVTCDNALGCCIGPMPSTTQAGCPDCNLPWGGTILDGQTVQAFLNPTEACGGTCAQETRTCTNGVLSGTYTNQACSVDVCIPVCQYVPRSVECFVAGTQIEMADGTSQDIEKIKVGDQVVIFDEELNKNEISTVTETLHHEPRSQMMYKFNFNKGDGFTVTGEHLIFTSNAGYVTAATLYKDFKLKKNNYLVAKDSSEIKIINITAYEDAVSTYNIHVKGISDNLDKYGRNGRGHNYFANGVLAHNLKACPAMGTSEPPHTAPGTDVNCVDTRIIPLTDMCGVPYTGCSDMGGSPECVAPLCSFVPRDVTCFVGGTQVELADGTTKSIEKIKIGDQVVIFDEESNEKQTSAVTETLHHEPRSQMMYKFNFENGSEFTVTGEHLIYTSSGYVPAAALHEDYKNKKNNFALDKNSTLVGIQSIFAYIDKVPTYNIHVKGISDDLSKYGKNGRGHNYFANGILAHNLKECPALGVDIAPTTSPGTNVNCLTADIIARTNICGDNYTGCSISTGSPSCTAIEDGACGVAHGAYYAMPPPAADLCGGGTASAVVGAGPYTWSCTGINSPMNESCSTSDIQCGHIQVEPSFYNPQVAGPISCASIDGDACIRSGPGAWTPAPCCPFGASCPTAAQATCSLGGSSLVGGICVLNNSCSATQPACAAASQCSLTVGTPTMADQAWVLGAPNCGYTCINGYSGANCTIAPNSCAPNPACLGAGSCSLTVGTPTSVNQAWVLNAPNCGYSCINGYSGANCTIAPAMSCAANPACAGAGGCSLTVGTPTSVNQAWVRNALNCGFSCINGYTGLNCLIPPANSCAANPACAGAGGCSLTVGTPTSVNQAWVLNAPNCGYSCINGYAGANCEIPPANYCAANPACAGAGACSLTVGTPSSMNQGWVLNAPNCGFSCINGYTGASCQIAPVTYSWYTGVYGACSGGVQTRTVECRNDSTMAVVADAFCNIATKPAATDTTNCDCEYIEETRVLCFVAGTPITLFDGTTIGIDKVKVGDKVLIYDEVTGRNKVSPVNEVLHHEPKRQMMYKFTFENKSGFVVTAEHLIYTESGYVPAMQLYKNWKSRIANKVLDLESNFINITHITAYEDEVATYNLHVDGISDDVKKYGRVGRGHNYYADGILAHNLKYCDPYGPDYFGAPKLPGTSVWCLPENTDTQENDFCIPAGPYEFCTDSTTCVQYPYCGEAHGSSYPTMPPATSDFCAIGTKSAITDAGSSWTWTCTNGFGTANCSASK